MTVGTTECWSCGATINYALPDHHETILAAVRKLREAHFACAHTDVVGDEEFREGYLKGISALAIELALEFAKAS